MSINTIDPLVQKDKGNIFDKVLRSGRRINYNLNIILFNLHHLDQNTQAEFTKYRDEISRLISAIKVIEKIQVDFFTASRLGSAKAELSIIMNDYSEMILLSMKYTNYWFEILILEIDLPKEVSGDLVNPEILQKPFEAVSAVVKAVTSTTDNKILNADIDNLLTAQHDKELLKNFYLSTREHCYILSQGSFLIGLQIIETLKKSNIVPGSDKIWLETFLAADLPRPHYYGSKRDFREGFWLDIIKGKIRTYEDLFKSYSLQEVKEAIRNVYDSLHKSLGNSDVNVAVWDIKLTVHDLYVSGSSFGRLIYLFSSALEAVEDVEFEVVDLGKGSLWAKFVLRIKSPFAKEQVKEVFEEFVTDIKKAKDGVLDKEFGQHTANTKKVEQETDNLKTENRLKEQELYTPEQLIRLREAEVQKIEAETRLAQIKAANEQIEFIKRSSEMMIQAIDPFTRLTLEANGIYLFEKHENYTETCTPEQIEEISFRGDLLPPEYE